MVFVVAIVPRVNVDPLPLGFRSVDPRGSGSVTLTYIVALTDRAGPSTEGLASFSYIGAMRPSSILILGALLIAGTAYATPGVQDERAEQRKAPDLAVVKPEVMDVFVVRAHDPLAAIMCEVPSVGRVEYHAGTMAPRAPGGGFIRKHFAHSSGGAPG